MPSVWRGAAEDNAAANLRQHKLTASLNKPAA
jgi:hypothetical protein